MDDIWFQQDGATCHAANVTLDLLRTVFENRIISRNSYVSWPPWSYDLTPLEMLELFFVGNLAYSIIKILMNVNCYKKVRGFRIYMRFQIVW